MEAYMLVECFLTNLVFYSDKNEWNSLIFESFKKLVTIELLRLFNMEFNTDGYGFALKFSAEDFKNYCEITKCPELSNGWLDASQLVSADFLLNFKSNHPFIVFFCILY